MDEPCISVVNSTFSSNMHCRVMIGHENIGVDSGHLIREIIMQSLLDIEEIRFFGNGVTE